MNPEDILQDRLAQLETGAPLETVVADLPPAEAALVRMAASLREAASVEQSNTAAQRQRLVRAVKEKTKMSPQQPRSRWIWPTALAGGLATVFACVAVLALSGAAWWVISRQTAARAVPTGPAPITKATDVPVQATDPQAAVLTQVRGVVEIQAADGSWAKAESGVSIRAGARLRTRSLSSATLAFYDGSQTVLGPDTELSVDTLNAPKSGARVILLTQWVGDSDHAVAKSNDPDSRYEVRTASGTGQAKGTAFHVSVSIAQVVRFDVTDGVVEVSNLDVVVSVVAGQSTTVVVGEEPQLPVFRIEGEGEVTNLGPTWTIAGYDFVSDVDTEIVGEPHVGDWVAFTGHFLPDGTRFADRIVLRHRSLENRFAFTGETEVISATAWTVAGKVVRVDDVTRIEPGLTVGDEVEVRGGIAADGTLWATSIQGVIPNGFRFTGVVETMGDDAWTVSGISVTVNLSTTIEPGLLVGDRVLVTGQVLDDGTWLALTLNKLEAETFDFVGVVINTDPWIVSGIALTTDERTEIDEGILVGNRVRVRGRVLADGTWLAESIEQLDEGQRHHIEFTARVQSIDPWIVGAVVVTVDDHTKIIGAITVGDWVTVQGNLLPDGTVLAKKITRVSRAQGCLVISTVVKVIEANQLILFDGQTVGLEGGPSIEGELNVASVILIRVCVDEHGDLHVVRIIVIFQLDDVPVIILPPAQASCVRAVVVTQGVITLPNGGFIPLNDSTWLQIELKGKGDKAEIKVNGNNPTIEIKVKDKGKKAGVEVKVKGKGNLFLQGAGWYPLAGVVVVGACANEQGVVFVAGGAEVITWPLDGGQGLPLDCKEGPGLGLGHCKDKHDDKKNDDDD